MVVWTMISFVALAVAWLWKGRHIALLVDRLITRPAVLLPVSPVMYDGGGLVIGGGR